MIVNTSCSDSNIKEIQAQFDKVLSHSQGIYHPETDALFAQWFEAKRDFIEAWGGYMIIEMPTKVVFELSQKDKDSRLDDFINSVSITYDNETLACFIDDNRKGFFQNKVVSSWHNEDRDIDIPEGMKLIKAFKYFEDDPITLKDLQTQASMIIQEDKVEGTLCFSVHPLDFLSSSENTYKWRSCHALDGEYRAGNLSYMVDKSTIMCYLRGVESARLPNFSPEVPWNSKKWRMLLFFSEKWDVLFAGRQYPFFSRSALDVVMDSLLQTTVGGYGAWSQWHNDQINTYEYKDGGRDGGYLAWQYICIAGEMFRLDEVVKDGEHSLQFNDLLRSSCYKPYYCFKRYKAVGETPKVIVGGAVPCVYCGVEHIVAPDTMLCEECELEMGHSEDDRFGYCDCCDRRILMSEGHYIGYYGQVICDWCYDSNVQRCADCGNDYYKDDVVYDKKQHNYLCTCCNGDRRRNRAEWHTASAATVDPIEIEMTRIQRDFNDSLTDFIRRLEREALNYDG